MNRRENIKAGLLYEEILRKNFQLIEDVMNKFSLTLQKQQVLEERLNLTIDNLKEQSAKLQCQTSERQYCFEQIESKIVLIQTETKNMHKADENLLFPAFFTTKNSFANSLALNVTAPVQQKKTQFPNKHQQNISELSSQLQTLSQKIEAIQYFVKEMTDKVQEEAKASKELWKKLQSGKVDNKIFNYNCAKMRSQLLEAARDYCFERQSLNETKSHDQIANIKISWAAQKRELQRKIACLIEEVQKKVEIKQIENIQNSFKISVQNTLSQIGTSFADKLETKKSLILFEKKMERISLFLATIKENGKDQIEKFPDSRATFTTTPSSPQRPQTKFQVKRPFIKRVGQQREEKSRSVMMQFFGKLGS